MSCLADIGLSRPVPFCFSMSPLDYQAEKCCQQGTHGSTLRLLSWNTAVRVLLSASVRPNGAAMGEEAVILVMYELSKSDSNILGQNGNGRATEDFDQRLKD